MTTKTVDVMSGVVRPIAKFSASIWGDHFLKYASTDDSSSSDLVIHSSRKIKLKPEYRWLVTVISKSLQGRGGNFDNLTKLKLRMLLAIVRSDKVDWGYVLYEEFCQMVIKKDGRVQQTESSGSEENKSSSKEEAEGNVQSATSKSPRGKTAPEGPSQVDKGKGILVEEITETGTGTLQIDPQTEATTGEEYPYTLEQENELFDEFIQDMNKGDMFKKFLDKEGEFNTSIKNDIIGMLSLLEASHLRFREEDILEKAFNFTTKQFETMLLHDRDILDHINPHLVQQVTHALNQSLLKGFIRIDARNYISFYENCNTHVKKLLEFAKLDFNVLQRMYQIELAELTRWWKNLDIVNKFPFSRDRLVECYFFALAMYFEPEYAYGRKTVTKMLIFVSVMDDIYDAYGTWEELVIFKDVINRWERNDLNHLPKYIMYFNDALHDYIEVLEIECAEREMMHGVQYFKEVLMVMSNAYMKEARWLHNKYIPTLEEYMSVALITSGALYLTVASFIGMNPNLANLLSGHLKILLS
ncbi:sesquiterpene synthase 2-like [Impatiens glandulifera]|uniref:sesquiterpene synthase 2-like n=1 Tax=Impatiens glandulifera TaxID=253017 RepID=UPI001FB13487|nr:sesquiterpene synthase 2-like [Impatiens glandulifera]